MKKIYISGTGETEIALATKKLKKAEYKPVIASGSLGDRLKILLDCQAIFMLNDWEKNKESNIEHVLAGEVGLEIIYDRYWDVDKYVQKMPSKNKTYVSLEEARKLANKAPSDCAYVYDRFAGVSGETDAKDLDQLIKDFEAFVERLPKKNAPLLDSNFELVPISTFDTKEQIEYLMKAKKFFYAPLKS